MTSTVQPLRHNAPFRRLVVAKVANEFSGAIANVALPLLVLVATGSATRAGLTLFVFSAALIAMQASGGAIVDRYGASATLRASSAIQAAGWVVVVVAISLPDASLMMILLGVATAGGASGLDGPSEHSLVKAVVPHGQLGQALALGQGREAAAGLAGGPIGGALFGVFPAAPLFVQAALNMLAAWATPKVTRTASDADRTLSFAQEVLAGFRIVWKDQALRGIALISGIANFPIVALPLTLVAYFQQAAVSPLEIGIFASALGAGMVGGAFLAGPASTRFRLGYLGVTALGLFALGQVVIVSVFEHFWLTTVVLALSAVALPSFNAAVGAYTLAVTPAHQAGRVSAASGVPGMILMPVAALTAGVLYDHAGASVSLALSAALAVLAAVLMFVIPALRHLPLLTHLDELPGNPAAGSDGPVGGTS